ncbi:ankyrin repeat-containing domain protein [Aspergillus floccosus]
MQIQSCSPLHLAAMRGHDEIVKLLLATQRMDLSMRDKKSRTALHLAAKNGFPVVVETFTHIDQLLFDVKDDEGSTPLFLAVLGGLSECTSLLLQKSDLLQRDHNQNTILHAAAEGRNVQTLQKLLGRRRKVKGMLDEPNEQQDRPIHVALRNRGEGVAEVLIKLYRKYFRSQVDPRMGNNDTKSDGEVEIIYPKQSALRIAMANGLKRTIPLLIRHESVRIRDGPCGGSDLLMAAERGFAGVVTDILSRQRSVTHQDLEETPATHRISYRLQEDIPEQIWLKALDIASSCGHLDVVEQLVRFGPSGPQETLSHLHHGVKAAVQAGHVAIVRYLASMIPPNARPSFSPMASEMMLACASGNVDMVRALLDFADVDCQDSFGNSGLMLAAYHGHARTVRLLLLRKANTELRDDAGSTALSDAAAQGSLECVELLIEAGADVNVQTFSGATPISRAVQSVQKDTLEVVAVLLRAEADVELQDGAGRDALSKATVPQDGREILEKILKVAQPSKASLERALIYAAERLAKDSVEILLSKGAVLPPDLWPIHVAIGEGDVDMVRFLLDQGASKDQMIRGQKGTPLQLAVYEQKRDVVDLLINKDVDVNYIQDPFHTALHVAAFKDNTGAGEFVRRLLQAGASVDKNGGRWGTVLHAALWNTSRLASITVTVVNILLGTNDNLRHLKDGEGRLPLHIAARLGDVEIMKLVAPTTSESWLDLKDGHGRTPLHFAAMATGAQAVEHITETFKSEETRVLELTDIHGWRPLHWACKEGQGQTARILMQTWADIDLPTSSGHTPRKLAIYHWKDDMLKELARDFNIDDPGEHGQDENSAVLRGEYQKNTLCSGCTCVCINLLTRPDG